MYSWLRDWHAEPCQVTLIAPEDAEVRAIVRRSPNVEELQLHHPWREVSLVTNNAIAALVPGCQRLRRLLVASRRGLTYLSKYSESSTLRCSGGHVCHAAARPGATPGRR